MAKQTTKKQSKDKLYLELIKYLERINEIDNLIHEYYDLLTHYNDKVRELKKELKIK